MSANAQTSTEAGPKPSPVAATSGALTNGSTANAGKKNNAANEEPKKKNGNNANANAGKEQKKNGNNATTGDPEENAAQNNGKNPKLEKITESLSALEGAMTSANCGDIQTKAKKVIENADPVIEAIEKQELRENNSQLSEVKGKVRTVTNSIRQKCPKGAAANAPPPAPEPPNAKCKTLLESKGITDRSSFRRWSLTAHPNKGGDEEEFKEVSSCANSLPAKGQSPVKEKSGQEQALPKVGQLWNVITSWASGNTRTGYDAIVKIIGVDEKGVTFEATKVNQTANMNKNGMKLGDTRTYTLEEWKALRKVLEKNANNSATSPPKNSAAAPAPNTAGAPNTAAAPKEEQTEPKQEGGKRKTRRHKRKCKKTKSRRVKRTR